MHEQPLSAQIGEIKFRRKLYQQQVEGQAIFDDEFDAEGIEALLIDRMEETFDNMTSLRKNDVVISPYIEIGAERCQRALVMENDLGAVGAAVDISYEMLKSCEYYKKIFNKEKIPLRICCDANNLPFMTGSIPFVFCYATIHHFPDPIPVIRNVHRVLSPGGHFFFSGESYKRILHINLYEGKSYAESRGSSKLRKVIDYFLSDDRQGNEIQHGIIENEEISIGRWKQALCLFEEKQAELRSLKYFKSDLYGPRYRIDFLLTYLLGGLISGICRKSGVSRLDTKPIQDILICPSCFEIECESELAQDKHGFFCVRCGDKYPIINDVVFLISPVKIRKLYPNIIEMVNSSS